MPLVTTSRLNQTITNATCALGTLMNEYAVAKKRGNPCACTMEKAEYLFMALTVLNQWQQNPSGSTEGKTNYITQEQLSTIVSTVDSIVIDTPCNQATRNGNITIDFLQAVFC